MEKIKNWLAEQSKESKVIISITLILHFSFAIYRAPFYLLSQYGLGTFLGRSLGELLGGMFPLVLVSAVISLIPYFIFREVAETFKKYFDYFAMVFMIITNSFFWLIFSHPILSIL